MPKKVNQEQISTILLAYSFPSVNGFPGATTSSPLAMTATFGTLWTAAHSRPAEAISPMSAGDNFSPLAATVSALRMSLARSKILRPSSAIWCAMIASVFGSQNSSERTALAPSGSGAPVVTRTACPLASCRFDTSPAARCPTTFSSTGFSSVAPARSDEMTAYPSLREEVIDGASTLATISSASILPVS